MGRVTQVLGRGMRDYPTLWRGGLLMNDHIKRELAEAIELQTSIIASLTATLGWVPNIISLQEVKATLENIKSKLEKGEEQ